MARRPSEPRTQQLVASGTAKATARRARGKGTTATDGRPPRTIYLIRRVQFMTYLRLEERLKPFGLTVAQYMVISMLGHSGRLSSAQLSRRFEVTPQTMFKLIASLRRKGAIARRGVSGDRRALEVSLTAAGRRLLVECEDAVDKLEAELFRGFAGRELRALRGGLVKFLRDNRPGS
ncbi:MAG: MarR family winged helix-turn-helix transcriptional regulator [Candidatus Eiseniibacteriota bacterium]